MAKIYINYLMTTVIFVNKNFERVASGILEKYITKR